MKKNIRNTIILFLIGLIQTSIVAQTIPICQMAQPICSDTTNVFPNSINTDIPPGPDYGCLDDYMQNPLLSGMSNPQWYYFKISDDGVIELQLAQYDDNGNGIDLDFAMWGPYNSLNEGCDDIMDGKYPLQCSNNSDAVETIGIGTLGGGNAWYQQSQIFPFLGNFTDGTSTPPPAVEGQYYIIIVSNPDNEEGTISLEQTDGDGAIDCTIITTCSIDVEATAGNCDATTNEFSVSGTINFDDAPDNGQLIVEDCNGNSVSFDAPFNSPIDYTIEGIEADGNACQITAYFTENNACISSSEIYQNPEPCVSSDCTIELTATPGNCNSSTNEYSVSGTINFDDAPDNGQLIVEDCNGNSISFDTPFNSPIDYTLENIEATGENCEITAYFTADNTCETISSYQQPEPCGCTPPNIITTPIVACDTANLHEAIDENSTGSNLSFYQTENDATNAVNPIDNLVSEDGNYWVRAETANSETCFSVEEIEVTISQLSYEASITEANCGSSDGTIELEVEGGVSPYMYSIDGGTNMQTDHVFNHLQSGNYAIYIQDDNDCEVGGNEHISNQDGPQVDTIIAQEVSCFGDCDGSLQIDVSGGIAPYTYNWYNESGNMISNEGSIMDSLCAGDYNVVITDEEDCELTVQHSIEEPEELDASILNIEQNYCEDEAEIVLEPAQNGGEFFGPGITDNIFTPSEAGNGTHTIGYVIDNGQNCIDSSSYIIHVSSPTASFGAEPNPISTEDTQVHFTNQSEGGEQYFWDFGDGDSSEEKHPSHSFPQDNAGSYTVTLFVTDENGCTDTASVIITVEEAEMDYTIPNVFTPNGDDQNDEFKLIDPQNIQELSIVILNRWGETVFESEKISFAWNGKVNNNGAMCSDGVYFYKIKMKNLSTEKNEHGFVHLIDGK